MISNPISKLFGEEFTYEGGNKLYHFSPRDNGYSKTRECNVIFFANDEQHALDVLRRMFQFFISINERYSELKKNGDYYDKYSANIAIEEAESAKIYIHLIDEKKIKVSEVPTNQFFKVGWASNDTINIYKPINYGEES